MEGIDYQDIEGSGFVEGIAGQFANCRVWFDAHKQVVGITAIGQEVHVAPKQESQAVQNVQAEPNVEPPVQIAPQTEEATPPVVPTGG